MTMSHFQAHREAHRRWSTHGIKPGDRYGAVVARRKSVLDRFEVGYQIRGGEKDVGNERVVIAHERVVMGHGPTWEAAFGNVPACEACCYTVSDAEVSQLSHTCGVR